MRFLGYVSEQEYYAYLNCCAVIVDLTVLEDCLVCGAYEALAARRPLIVSNTRVLADYFGTAAMLTDNTPEAIRENVERAYAQRTQLAQQAAQWAARNELYMEERIAALKYQLRLLSTSTARGAPSRLGL